MISDTGPQFPVLEPDLQVSFYYKLKQIDKKYLSQALRNAVHTTHLNLIDAELSELVNPAALKRVAEFGIRGEIVFPVPALLRSDPHLLAYYRLLLGFSKKELYNKGPFGRFARLEDGDLPDRLDPQLMDLCRSLIGSSEILVSEIDDLSLVIVRDLQILTIGPQLRGGRLNMLGDQATQEVFDLVSALVADYTTEVTKYSIRVKTPEARVFGITFGADPDVQLVETLSLSRRHILAIEIKGGADVSNVHNRIGEAEKSHQKAKQSGFPECWTIHRAAIDRTVAKSESLSTDLFFSLDAICDPSTYEHQRFRTALFRALAIKDS